MMHCFLVKNFSKNHENHEIAASVLLVLWISRYLLWMSIITVEMDCTIR